MLVPSISQILHKLPANSQLAEDREWGTATRLFLDDATEAVLVEIAADWHSSVHLHRHKSNEFIVLSGELQIAYLRPGGNFPDKWIKQTLCPQKSPLIVPAAMRHAFYSASDVVAIEIYRAVAGEKIDVNDIVRFTERGRGPLPI